MPCLIEPGRLSSCRAWLKYCHKKMPFQKHCLYESKIKPAISKSNPICCWLEKPIWLIDLFPLSSGFLRLKAFHLNRVASSLTHSWFWIPSLTMKVLWCYYLDFKQIVPNGFWNCTISSGRFPASMYLIENDIWITSFCKMSIFKVSSFRSGAFWEYTSKPCSTMCSEKHIWKALFHSQASFSRSTLENYIFVKR